MQKIQINIKKQIQLVKIGGSKSKFTKVKLNDDMHQDNKSQDKNVSESKVRFGCGTMQKCSCKTQSNFQVTELLVVKFTSNYNWLQTSQKIEIKILPG